jgi:hypothetical protein
MPCRRGNAALKESLCYSLPAVRRCQLQSNLEEVGLLICYIQIMFPIWGIEADCVGNVMVVSLPVCVTSLPPAYQSLQSTFSRFAARLSGSDYS